MHIVDLYIKRWLSSVAKCAFQRKITPPFFLCPQVEPNRARSRIRTYDFYCVDGVICLLRWVHELTPVVSNSLLKLIRSKLNATGVVLNRIVVAVY